MTLSAVRSAASTIAARRSVTLSSDGGFFWGGGFLEAIWSRSLKRRQQGIADQADCKLGLFGVEDQGRKQPQGAGLGDVDDQATLEQVGAHRGRVDSLLEADAEHKPATAHLANPVEGEQGIAQSPPQLPDRAQQARVVDD